MQHYLRFGSTPIAALLAGSILTGSLNDSAALKAMDTAQNLELVALTAKSSQVVDLNGIQFQVITSDHEINEESDSVFQQHSFTLPKPLDSLKYPEGMKRLNIAVHITNRTSKPIFFGRFGYIKPTFIDVEGKEIKGSASARGFNPKDCGSVLISPGRSANFVSKGMIIWNNGSPQLSFGGCSDYEITFDEMKPGIYQLQILYGNDIDEVDSNAASRLTSRLTGKPLKIERIVWKGKVKLPLVEIKLVR